MTGGFLELALAIVPMVVAITLHEAAHGYAALAMGDDTAKLAGRLSLNPLRHVDRVGTVLLPGVLLLSGYTSAGSAFVFGWAKPVPVAAWKFRDPRRGMMVVAAAGPAMNFFLAWVAALLMPRSAARDRAPRAGRPDPLSVFLFYFIQTNLVLGLFNLLPIPPLDGGRIAVGLLPEKLAFRWAQLERAGHRHRAPGRVPAAAAARRVRHRVRSVRCAAERRPALGGRLTLRSAGHAHDFRNADGL